VPSKNHFVPIQNLFVIKNKNWYEALVWGTYHLSSLIIIIINILTRTIFNLFSTKNYRKGGSV
jgi:hypothetical protein